MGLILIFAAACKTDPVKEKAKHLARGKQFLLDKKFREARIEFRNVLVLDKNSVEGFMGLAEAATGLNSLQEAFDALTQAEILDPKNLEAKVKIGNLFLLSANDVQSVTFAETRAADILGADPNHIEGYILRAGVRSAQRRFPEAEADLAKAVSLNTNRPESYLSYARYWDQRARAAANLAEADKYKAEAQAKYDTALKVGANSAVAHLAYADFLFSWGRKDQAESELKKAVELDPKDQVGLTAIAKYYEAVKNYAEAEKYINRIAEITGDKNEARANIIDLHARDGKLDQAITEYQDLIKQSPKYLHAYVQLSGLLMRKGDIPAAVQQIGEAVKINKSETDVLVMKSRLNLAQGKVSEAISDLQQVLKQEGRLHQGLYLMAEAQLQDGDTEKAKAFTNDLLRYYPDNPAGLLMMIRVLLSPNKRTTADGAKDASEALRIADKIVTGVQALYNNPLAMQNSRLDPDSLKDIESKGYAARATAKVYLKDIDGAKADYEKSSSIDSRNAETLASLASIYLLKGDLENARKTADQALSTAPISDSALANSITIFLARKEFDAAFTKLDEIARNQPFKKSYVMDQKVRVYAAKGDMPSVERTLKEILASDPSYMNAYFELFAFYKEQKQMDTAMAQLQEVVNKRPDNAHQMSQAYLLLGMMEDEKGRFIEAVKNYEKSLSFDSRSSVATIALNNLAWDMADKQIGSIDKAVEYARTAIQMLPQVASYYDTLGWTMLKKGNINQLAIDQFLKAIERKGDDPSFYRHLGDAYKQNREPAKARQAYEKALAVGGPKYNDAEMIKKSISELK